MVTTYPLNMLEVSACNTSTVSSTNISGLLMMCLLIGCFKILSLRTDRIEQKHDTRWVMVAQRVLKSAWFESRQKTCHSGSDFSIVLYLSTEEWDDLTVTTPPHPPILILPP